MSPPDDDPLDPKLARLGARFRALEQAEREALATKNARSCAQRDTRAQEEPGWREARPARSWTIRRRRRRYAGAAALLLTSAAVVVVLNVASPAGATSPINRAPAEAKKAGSVRFTSSLQALLGGQSLARYSETGALSFQSGDYASRLTVAGGDAILERRQVGRIIYARDLRLHYGRQRETRWRGVRALRAGAERSRSGYLQIDPQVVLHVLAAAPQIPVVAGRENIGGVPTIHYRLSTTLGAFLATAQHESVSTRPGEADVPGRLDVWLDRHGRPVRVSAAFAGLDRTGSVAVTIITTFADYGGPVKIAKPHGAAVSRGPGTAAPNGPLGGDPILVLERVLFRTQRVGGTSSRLAG